MCDTDEGRNVYVKQDATGANTGDSWQDAYTDLQNAIGSAVAGDRICVARGTYRPWQAPENTSPNDPVATPDPGMSFELRPGVALYGGFAGNEDVSAGYERDWGGNRTILSGEIGKAEDGSPVKAHHVVRGARDATIDGFIITGGSSPDNGGGMHNYQCSPRVRNCTFEGNTAKKYGAAMFNHDHASPVVTDCIFVGNKAGSGGGILNMYYSSPPLVRCTFRDNIADGSGGGVYNTDHSCPRVMSCEFIGNEAHDAGHGGGGMRNTGHSSPHVACCHFSRNSATAHGGGMENDSASFPSLTKCRFVANRANHDGGGVYNQESSPILLQCVLVENVAHDSGGGIANYLNDDITPPTVLECTFLRNKAASGGGLHSNQCDSVVTDCVFVGNNAHYGGAMLNRTCADPEISNCMFIANKVHGKVFDADNASPQATHVGGAMYSHGGSSPSVTNCVFSGNEATGSGGGMRNSESSPKLMNCTFTRNEAGLQGGALSNSKDSSPTVTNTILWGNIAGSSDNEIHNDADTCRPVLTHCDIEGCLGRGVFESQLGEDGGGNIAEDPMFVDASDPKGPDGEPATSDDGLCLNPDSPCIDVGTSTGAPDIDILGRPRPEEEVDIGAYEFGSPYMWGMRIHGRPNED